ncbi:lipase [Cyathus striatus]|nr:lipase [Cyathus striatus]
MNNGLPRIFALLAGAAVVSALPTLEGRQSISTLSAAQVSTYKPYTYYASAAYCKPATTLAWNCGVNCNARSVFKPVASGGDGTIVQFWYVGYDSSLAVISYIHANHQFSLPILTDADFFLDNLDSTLFPGLSSSIKTHDGFGEAHKKSANAVLAAVKTALTRYSSTQVTIVGHSLGGALALIASVHLPLHLPSNITFKTVTYGMPRVGNQEFVDYINARRDLTRIVNQDDLVPIVPGRFLGFAHTKGETHIVNSGDWINCPGQDNTDSQCTIGYVPNILSGDTGDHKGPYDGVTITCSA